MISIGSVSINRNDIANIRGTVPINQTWDQYIPIVDEDGERLTLTNYKFELVFRDRWANVVLRLSTDGGEILKTTDTGGDTLRVYTSPTTVSEGDYDCTFAAKNSSTSQIWLLARGMVSFVDAPATFS